MSERGKYYAVLPVEEHYQEAFHVARSRSPSSGFSSESVACYDVFSCFIISCNSHAMIPKVIGEQAI